MLEDFLDDCALVKSAREGSEEALSALLSRYAPVIKIHAASYNITGFETDDLIQEGSIGFLAAIKNFNPERGASFHTFADVCVTRRMVSAAKSALRQKHQPLNASVPLDDERLAGEAPDRFFESPEEMIVSRENISDIKNAIEKCFSPLERRVLLLYISGLSYSSIAKKLNKGEKAIDNALQRIKKKLIQLPRSIA